MKKGAIGIFRIENRGSKAWQKTLRELCPGRDVFVPPDDAFDPADIRYALVWKPEPGMLARYSNLAAIFNSGAGVDAVLADPTIPDVPLVRASVDDLTGRMTEYVAMHVLMHHRQARLLAAAQREKRWARLDQWAASKVRVGILGMGVLGRDAAEVLHRIGFDVAGWSRSEKRMPGIKTFAGAGGLAPFLARTDILVCLLPLTDETRGILNRKAFSMLARDGVLGGPVLINAGRGPHQVESDILAALDDGTLQAVTLDVFENEPLPPESPFWLHPKVTISPHNAADNDPDAISAYIAKQIERFESGLPFENVVDRVRGY